MRHGATLATLRLLRPLLWTTVPFLIADRLTKWAVVTGRMPRGTIIPNVLEFSHVENPGAAFGMMRGWNWVFVGAALVGIVLIGVYYYRLRELLWPRIALGCLLGGLLGNLIDRIGRQAVIDFIHFRYWWVFNVADIAVFVGACLFAVCLLRQGNTTRSQQDS